MRRFRDSNPLRRTLTSKNPTKNWAAHKPDLKEDFNSYCGYCHSHDSFRHTYFEVDHFIPKDFIIKNNWGISLTKYSNLVYSCKFCNNAKWNNWPSNSATLFSRRGKGYIDPCHINFEKQFYRTNKGEIKGKTALGKWMCTKAFKFDQRKETIIVLWNLNYLRMQLETLGDELIKHRTGSKKYNEIEAKLYKYSYDYTKYHKELIKFYDE